MNIITREIMARFKIDSLAALEIQDALEQHVFVDFSEATQAELNDAYDEAFAFLHGVEMLLQVTA